MKIYTRTGDRGETALFGGGRVTKTHARIQAVGTVDELNALIGVVLSRPVTHRAKDLLSRIQPDLFALGAHLATPAQTRGKRPSLPPLPSDRVEEMEAWIDEADEDLAPLTKFIMPGGSQAGATLHLARAVCRRAERDVIAVSAEDAVAPEIVIYLNRLSDLLFSMARFVNQAEEVAESEWLPGESED